MESAKGVERCARLGQAEAGLGFRSAFNFIPAGPYEVPRTLRDSLVDRGFEIGVHDLHHDGRLLWSRSAFSGNAKRINGYLKEWGAVGFRAGFMLHNLDWFQDLEVDYDSSTFDTDPFEPQPEGVGTIFPFVVRNGKGPGFVELPYTLVQDFTLFTILRESTIDVWKQKLDWIAAKGGMAMVNVHPDYVCFDGIPQRDEFPVRLYEELLRYVNERYDREVWRALPREVAAFTRSTATQAPPSGIWPGPEVKRIRTAHKVWIDLDNTPHIPFFRPIIRELERRGHQVVLTARDAYQVCDLADLFGLQYRRLGSHFGRNKFMKVIGLAARVLQLLPFALKERPSLALNHGSRAQICTASLLRIPSVCILDYEHTAGVPLFRPTWEIAPEAVASLGRHWTHQPVLSYQGIKEDVYAPDFKPDPAVCTELGLRPEDLIVVVRPPATEAHYHNPEAERLFAAFMNRAIAEGAKTVLLPRNKRQEEWMRHAWPRWFQGPSVVVPSRAVDGLNLLWHADLVVSGGGTMNREAAALGIPVYTIFRGKPGAVDRQLAAEGRLVFIGTVDEVRDCIPLRRRDKGQAPDPSPRAALADILDHIERILSSGGSSERHALLRPASVA